MSQVTCSEKIAQLVRETRRERKRVLLPLSRSVFPLRRKIAGLSYPANSLTQRNCYNYIDS